LDWTQWIAVIRDIAVIFMGLLVGLAGLSVVLVMWLLYRKITPILTTVHNTVVNVQGTTEFLSEQAVRPVIRTAGFVNGMRRSASFLGTILRRGRRQS
jgi:hypothetical protein